MRRSGLKRLVLAGLAATGPAFAEPPASSAQAPAPKSVDEVVVTGQSQQQDRVEIDRRSYSTAKSLQAQSGTVADLLRTVPSVDVDIQGAVSLRGDQNVTILVDGKPTAEFAGASRATAVQSLPADRYERVEVITNPSAADSAEGSGGIINLISKQTRKAGYSGSSKAGLGERGQAIAAVNGDYNSAKLSLSGDVSLRVRDPASSRRTDIDTPLATDGTPASREVTDNHATTTSVVARLSADYDLDPRTRIGARLQAISIHLNETGGVYLATTGDDGSSGLFQQAYDGGIRGAGRLAGASFRRKLGDDQELTADLRTSRVTLRTNVLEQDISVQPAAPEAFDIAASGQTTDLTEFRADYKAASLADGELKLGYDGRVTVSDFTNLFGLGPTPGATTADPARSGAFAYREELNAAYATFQRKLGELTVLAGLRLEGSRTTLTGGETRRGANEFRPFPSLHLAYPVGEGRTVSASYSRRIDRPAPAQLNPLIIFGDRQILFSGNPALRPQVTDSFEVAYDAHRGATSIAATFYYRALHDAFAQVARDQDGGVILFTQDNLGDARKAGLSLAGNRQLTSTISLNLSGDAFWTEVPASALGLGEMRSGYVVSGRGALNWAPTADDFFQLNGRLTGRTITPQGSLGPTIVLDLGYRRRLTPSLFAIVTVQNLLDSNRQDIRFSTASLNGRRTLDGTGRTALVTLTYNFGSGARKPREPGIDYSTGPPVP